MERNFKQSLAVNSEVLLQSRPTFPPGNWSLIRLLYCEFAAEVLQINSWILTLNWSAIR